MTFSEAMYQLETLRRDAKSHFTNDGDDEVFRNDVEALTLAHGALRLLELGEHLVEHEAHWDINCDGYYPFCSHCGESALKMSRYCPNCGCKMITRECNES
jgi:hypothetical protein